MKVNVTIEEILTKKAFNHVKTVAKQNRLPLEVAALHALNAVHDSKDLASVEIEIEEPAQNPKKETPQPTKASPEEEVDYSEIETLGLSNRAFNSLTERADVRTLDQLTSMTADEILKIPYAGDSTLEDIQQKLADKGLYLKGEGPEKKPQDDFDRDESKDYAAIVNDWDGETKTFPSFAAKTLAEAWEVPPKEMLEELRSLFKGIWTKKSQDVEAAKKIVISELPATADQVDSVEALADQSDEALAETMYTQCGATELGHLTYGQAQKLIEYYNDSFESVEEEIEVDEEDFFI